MIIRFWNYFPKENRTFSVFCVENQENPLFGTFFVTGLLVNRSFVTGLLYKSGGMRIILHTYPSVWIMLENPGFPVLLKVPSRKKHSYFLHFGAEQRDLR